MPPMRYAIVLILLAYLPGLKADVPNDFDGDGISDLTSADKSSTEIVWSSISSQDSSEQLSETFGLSTDKIALAKWRFEDTPDLGVVRADSESGDLRWKILLDGGPEVNQVTFGTVGDIIISGADFDANGISDAAIVRGSEEEGDTTLIWTVRRNMFSASPAKAKVIRFGKLGDRVFFASPKNGRDWLGTFGRDDGGTRGLLRLKNVGSGNVRTLGRFPSILLDQPRPRPFPIEDPEGVDAVGFVIEDETETTIRVFTLRGKRIRKKFLNGTGTIVVGEYDSEDPGHEIYFETDSEAHIFNPFSGTLSEADTVTGIPIGETNVVLSEAEESQ